MSGNWARLGVVLPVGVFLLLFVAACSEVTRYRVLSFVFDGVPPPDELKESVEEEAREGQEQSSVQQSLAELRKNKKELDMPPSIVSVHEPYQKRECRQCHGASVSIDDIPRDAKLCDNCHKEQRLEEGWDHGPINLGTCVPCHKPHSSIYPDLLEEPVPDVCMRCHRDELKKEKYHEVPNFDDCTACHDPHVMY